jgi:hypothetical protein
VLCNEKVSDRDATPIASLASGLPRKRSLTTFFPNPTSPTRCLSGPRVDTSLGPLSMSIASTHASSHVYHRLAYSVLRRTTSRGGASPNSPRGLLERQGLAKFRLCRRRRRSRYCRCCHLRPDFNRVLRTQSYLVFKSRSHRRKAGASPPGSRLGAGPRARESGFQSGGQTGQDGRGASCS